MTNKIVPFPGGNPANPTGGGGDMEPRIAKLESDVGHIQTDIGEIKTNIRDIRNIDIRDLRNDAKIDFRILFAALIAATLGLAGLLAKGFHWL